jgi:hypothetical protein
MSPRAIVVLLPTLSMVASLRFFETPIEPGTGLQVVIERVIETVTPPHEVEPHLLPVSRSLFDPHLEDFQDRNLFSVSKKDPRAFFAPIPCIRADIYFVVSHYTSPLTRVRGSEIGAFYQNIFSCKKMFYGIREKSASSDSRFVCPPFS